MIMTGTPVRGPEYLKIMQTPKTRNDVASAMATRRTVLVVTVKRPPAAAPWLLTLTPHPTLDACLLRPVHQIACLA
jgi:hypothetical protein